jgi:serine/threonine protein kinase
MSAYRHEPFLPAGYVAERVLGRRGSVWVLRARKGDESLVLRIEEHRDSSEGLAELAVLSAIDHPGIAPLLDHGPLPGGGRFLARRWIDGEDLFEWSRSRSAEEIGIQVARTCPALDHLHRAGFVHADLKPENVIVTRDGRPVLCDFGLSRRPGVRQPGDGVSGRCSRSHPSSSWVSS